ncbi:MAG: hypothetical protein IJK81_11465 [Selenomonadaceae bacterium]|nr:hypothetical protein [Selenomonadaceae bacterium]
MTDKERARLKERYEEEWKPAYDMLMKLYPLTTGSLPSEIWKVIPDFEDYHASNKR